MWMNFALSNGDIGHATVLSIASKGHNIANVGGIRGN